MNVVVCENKNQIAEKVARRIVDLVKAKPNCVLGLATGSTPIETYQEVIRLAKLEKVSFKNVTTFNLDEYCNNPIVEQSYKYFMQTNLFYGLDLNPENINFPSEENYLEYDEMIKKAGGIDFQFLGIGGNGHIAFNEPGTPFDSKTHIQNLTKETIQANSRFFEKIEDVPTQAVSMGIGTIVNNCKEIVLVATGPAKAEAIKLTLEKVDVNVPSSILKNHNNATIYCDEAAASLI